MIRNFEEHAANERTFLAWIRTAVAIMGFGFIVEKLGLPVSAGTGPYLQTLITVDYVGQYTGFALIVVGLALIGGATVRFLTLRRLLEASREMRGVSIGIDLSLAALLLLLGLALVVYLLQLAVHSP